MSERDRDELDREDLVARARRGLLSAGERETLARALDRDPELRAAYRVGLAIDRAGAVQGGDDALIAHAADAALARAAEMTSRTRAVHAGEASRSVARAASALRYTVAAAVALSVICASGIATALFTGAIQWPFRSAASPASDQAPAPAAPPKPKLRRERQQSPQAQPAPSQAQDEPAVLAPVAEKLARKPSASAAQLFHEANAARRDGDLRRARRLYAQLIAMQPGSDEARLARVSLGSLLLAAGDAHGAEREFRAYLAAGGGQLREEALVGQAQSLGKLGRAGEERAAWRRLLQAHPSSVYAAQARLRLDALADAQHESAH